MKDYATELGVPVERIAMAGIPRSEVNRFIEDHLKWREERRNDNTTLKINNQPILPPRPWDPAEATTERRKRSKKGETPEEENDDE